MPRIELPPAYLEKPHAFVKHEFLRNYIDQLFFKVGTHLSQLGLDEIIFVDCFAGPWQEEGDDLESTSIRVAIDKMVHTRTQLGNRFPSKFKGIFVEQDPNAFQRLEVYLEKRSKENAIELIALHGDFVSLRDTILNQCSRRSFCFFFIDPKGYKEIGPSALEAYINRPNSEVLINFMYEFVNRFKGFENDKHEALMVSLFGRSVSAEDSDHLHSLYCAKLREHAQIKHRTAYTAYLPVLKPTQTRTIYFLVYLTYHPIGLITFKEQADKMLTKQFQIHAQGKQDHRIANSGQPELFEALASDIRPFGYGSNDVELEARLLNRIQADGGRLIVDTVTFANLLVDLDCGYEQLQKCVQRLLSKNILINSNSKKRARKIFVDHEKQDVLSLSTTNAPST